MECTIWDQVQIRTSNEERMNRLAARLAALIVEPASDKHPAEASFSVQAQGKYDFLLSVHHREVLARYSVFFPKGENSAGGRYRFFLLPEKYIGAPDHTQLLLEFELNRSGIFIIDGEELLIEEASYRHSSPRNIVLSYVMNKLQDVLV